MNCRVTIKTDALRVSYQAVGNAFDLHDDAIEHFGPCAVSVISQPMRGQWAAYQRAIAPAAGTFKHFANDAELQAHLQYAQDNAATLPF